MRTTNLYFPTLKEIPTEAELTSHRLMLRSGMIRKLAAGLYTWMPLGLIVLRKVERIVRQEMNKIGAQELLMPVLAPDTLWQETARWEKFGPQLFKLQDRNKRQFCLSPTHEEIVTDLVRSELNSYKALPKTFYQIQTKFRDEIRPRFGVMRAREFLMKDAYSFHLNDECLENTYKNMHQAYCKIFERLQLKYRAIIADSGAIGGDVSQEFHVLADSGEDQIAFCNTSDYAANLEIASAKLPEKDTSTPKELELVKTPDITTMEELANFLDINLDQCIKTMLVRGSSPEHPIVALVLRGCDQLNTIKAEKIPLIATPLCLVPAEELLQIDAKFTPGFLGPVKGLPKIPVICDHYAMTIANFVCGANQIDQHYINANWERDCVKPKLVTDLRIVQTGDLSPNGTGTLNITRGIEVGHIFQLGTYYSEMMQANVLNAAGKSSTMRMGCYGIGISRIVAASIEQQHDNKGIIWPESISPFQLAIVAINYHKSNNVREKADKIYQTLQDNNIEVLLDDRAESPGVKFKDMDLIGMPAIMIISDKNLDNAQLELKFRSGSQQMLNLEQVVAIFSST